MSYTFKIIVSVFFITLYLSGFKANAIENRIPIAEKGLIDLSSIDFNEGEIVNLQGEWKFYWNQLIKPEDIEKSKNFDYVEVPKNLKGKIYKDTVISKYGYGTYHLRIIFDSGKKLPLMRLYTKAISTASNVYINGKLIGAGGVVSKSKQNSEPLLYLNLNDFVIDSDTVDIVIHVSNYHIRKLGLYYNLQLGGARYIENSRLIKTSIDLFIIGIIFFMMLYHFVLYFQRRKDKASLYFAIVCLAFGFYTLFISSAFGLINQSLSFEMAFRLKRASLYLSLPAMALFINYIFKGIFSKRMLKLIISICLAFILFTFAFKSEVNAYSITYFRYVGLFFTLYIFFVIIKAIFNKVQGATFLFLGGLIFTLTIIHDFLHNAQIINTTDISPIGLCFFLFSQAFLLSDKFNRSFVQNENLTMELTNINQNLESIIDERTQEITLQKNEIEEKNEELNQLIEEISTQRDNILEQKELIENIHKELSQSIDYAKHIQTSILPKHEILKKHIDDFFVLFKPKDKVSGDFYWWTNIEGHTIITAADCTGHGVPGAFMSMLGISFLREIIIKEYVIHPAVILRKLRKEIINALKQTGVTGEQKDGMDMALISINNETKVLQFAGAHNPLYIYRDNELIEIKGDKMPIAIHIKMEKFKMHEIKLQKGDQLYLFSDGYPDQFGGPKGKKFKYKPFKELLKSNLDKPMNKQMELLDKHFEEWKGMQEQIDDVIVIGLKI